MLMWVICNVYLPCHVLQIKLSPLPSPSDRCCTASERAKEARRAQQALTEGQEGQRVAAQITGDLGLTCSDREPVVVA